jgi:hypothetical protein
MKAIGPGSLVRCVKEIQIYFPDPRVPNLPRLNNIYTVRALEKCNCGQANLLLSEIVNPICDSICGTCHSEIVAEPSFDPDYFAPVDDDDIAIFRETDREVFDKTREPVG